MKLLNSLLILVESLRTKIRINPYLFGLLALAISLFFQFILNNYIKQETYLLVVISIFLTGWYGGFFPSFLVTIIGLLIADYYFVLPYHEFFRTGVTQRINGENLD